MIRCYNSIRIGFKHRGLHAVRSWTLAVMFVGCDCDVMFEKNSKNEVRGNTLITKAHLSNFDFIARPAPPCKKPGGQETHKYQKRSKKCKKPWKFHEKITKILVQYFHHLFVHQIEVSGNPHLTFKQVSGNTHLTFKQVRVIPFTCLPWFILVSFLIGWEVILSSPSFFCWLVATR